MRILHVDLRKRVNYNEKSTHIVILYTPLLRSFWSIGGHYLSQKNAKLVHVSQVVESFLYVVGIQIVITKAEVQNAGSRSNLQCKCIEYNWEWDSWSIKGIELLRRKESRTQTNPFNETNVTQCCIFSLDSQQRCLRTRRPRCWHALR